MDVIADGNCVQHLKYLLEFLAAWDKRPASSTPMAYQWCSALSEVAKSLGWDGIYTNRRKRSPIDYEEGFSEVGPGCDLLRLDDTAHARERPQGLNHGEYVDLLFMALKVGFRRFVPDGDQSARVHLDHTPHHGQIFEAAFSSDDDEVIVDAVCAWIVGDRAPAGSFMRYFVKRVEKATPFPPRLRQVCICAIGRIWRNEPTESTLEMVRLLNCLNADLDDVEEKDNWQRLLVGVIRSLVGFEGLPPHYWTMLGELASTAVVAGEFASRDVEVMKSLEEAEDWEKLEVWMTVLWQSLPFSGSLMPESMEGEIERVTLELTSRRPSVLWTFENLCERDAIQGRYKTTLQGICERARAGQ